MAILSCIFSFRCSSLVLNYDYDYYCWFCTIRLRGTRLLTESRLTSTESSPQWGLSRLSCDCSSSMKSYCSIGFIVIFSSLLSFELICCFYYTSKLRLFLCCRYGMIDATLIIFFCYLLVCEFVQSSAWRAYFAFDALSLLSMDEVVSSELWLDIGLFPAGYPPGSMISKSSSSCSWFKFIAMLSQ